MERGMEARVSVLSFTATGQHALNRGIRGRNRRISGRMRAVAALKYEWSRLKNLLDEESLVEIHRELEDGRVVIPIASETSRVVLPTDTVNTLVQGEICSMVTASENRMIGCLRSNSSDGVLLHVKEENWGFSSEAQLHCTASGRFQVRRMISSELAQIAVVDLISDRRTTSINEELELLVAVKEVNGVIDNIAKIEHFVNDHITVLSDVSSVLDDVIRFMKQVRAYRKIAEDGSDAILSKEEIFSFALLRSLALAPEEKLIHLNTQSTILRLHFADVELKRGLKALKTFVVENFDDAPRIIDE